MTKLPNHRVDVRFSKPGPAVCSTVMANLLAETPTGFAVPVCALAPIGHDGKGRA
jgi:hypothetical protein